MREHIAFQRKVSQSLWLSQSNSELEFLTCCLHSRLTSSRSVKYRTRLGGKNWIRVIVAFFGLNMRSCVSKLRPSVKPSVGSIWMSPAPSEYLPWWAYVRTPDALTQRRSKGWPR